MFKKNSLLAPLFACSLLLVMGALNHQPDVAAPMARTSFVAQPVALDRALETLKPAELLARAAQRIGPDNVHWLHVKTWQREIHDALSFEAEGRLERGPNHCARLEMTVRGGTEPAEVVIVSDGVGLAQRMHLPNQAPGVSTQVFAGADKKPLPVAQIEEILRTSGCGGPYCLLLELERSLENLVLDLGTWKEKAIIRLTGQVKAGASGCLDDPYEMPRLCHLYLDAQTLWPHRIEWWTAEVSEKPPALFLELEFRDAEINHPLSHDECVRAFTFSPE